MSQTIVGIKNDKMTINGKLTYSGLSEVKHRHYGLMMNARFIQGIFDDRVDPSRFSRFGCYWNADENTSALIKALPEWKRYGLLAFTVGLQGGMPVLTIRNKTIDNNPYSEDGNEINPDYLNRLDRLIVAADQVGMVVIVSLLYQGQSPRIKDGKCLRNAVKTACNFLREQGYQNVLIEVANEHDVGQFKNHPLVFYPDGIASLIDLAKQESGGMMVGSSSGGLKYYPEVCQASDIILVHGNGGTEQTYYNMIRDIQALNFNKPIICNEDSPRFTQLKIAYQTGTSWGYYNTHTKQEPPADWSVTVGEDYFFAWRMANGLEIDVPTIPFEEQFHLQGFEKNSIYQNKRWIRLASLYPEKINYVEFYKNGQFYDIAYEEPYYVNHRQTWIQEGVGVRTGDNWKVLVHLHDGKVLEKSHVDTS